MDRSLRRLRRRRFRQDALLRATDPQESPLLVSVPINQHNLRPPRGLSGGSVPCNHGRRYLPGSSLATSHSLMVVSTLPEIRVELSAANSKALIVPHSCRSGRRTAAGCCSCPANTTTATGSPRGGAPWGQAGSLAPRSTLAGSRAGSCSHSGPSRGHNLAARVSSSQDATRPGEGGGCHIRAGLTMH